MEIELRYFDGCPNWRTAAGHLTEALTRIGRTDVGVRLRRVTDATDAEALGFTGSPTVLVDGLDPFADPSLEVGLACRVYWTAAGTAGAPSVDQLVDALRSAPPAVPPPLLLPVAAPSR